MQESSLLLTLNEPTDRGDSGSWVIDAVTSDFVGHIVAGHPEDKTAYAIPATATFQQIDDLVSDGVQICASGPGFEHHYGFEHEPGPEGSQMTFGHDSHGVGMTMKHRATRGDRPFVSLGERLVEDREEPVFDDRGRPDEPRIIGREVIYKRPARGLQEDRSDTVYGEPIYPKPSSAPAPRAPASVPSRDRTGTSTEYVGPEKPWDARDSGLLHNADREVVRTENRVRAREQYFAPRKERPYSVVTVETIDSDDETSRLRQRGRRTPRLYPNVGGAYSADAFQSDSERMRSNYDRNDEEILIRRSRSHERHRPPTIYEGNEYTYPDAGALVLRDRGRERFELPPPRPRSPIHPVPSMSARRKMRVAVHVVVATMKMLRLCDMSFQWPLPRVTRTDQTTAGATERTWIQVHDEPDKLWTEITKDLVDRQAIIESGYPFEETDMFFYIMTYLTYVIGPPLNLTVPTDGKHRTM